MVAMCGELSAFVRSSKSYYTMTGSMFSGTDLMKYVSTTTGFHFQKKVFAIPLSFLIK